MPLGIPPLICLTESTMVKVSRIFSSIMILLGIYVISVASQFPPGTNGVLGPGFFPILLGILLIALSILQLVTSRKEPREENTSSSADPQATRRVIISCLVVIAYMILINIVGFLVATPIFLFTIMWFFSVRKKSILFTTSLVTTGLLYFIFLQFLSVSLPTGMFY